MAVLSTVQCHLERLSLLIDHNGTIEPTEPAADAARSVDSTNIDLLDSAKQYVPLGLLGDQCDTDDIKMRSNMRISRHALNPASANEPELMPTM